MRAKSFVPLTAIEDHGGSWGWMGAEWNTWRSGCWESGR
jgi:hypothetical protein